jgi:hypothetical protein
MSSHRPFGHLKHKLCPKEGPEVKLPIWLSTIKNQESTQICTCRWRATYRWKAFDEGYNFASDLVSIRGLYTKLWRPKVAGVPTLAISGLPFGSPGTKNHLDVGPVERCKVYYKGGGWWLPPSPGCDESCVSVLPVAHPSTKGAPTMH